MKLADLISVIVYDYLWGLPLVVLILGTGVYITVRTGFFQFRCFGMSMKHAFNSIFHREKKDENDTGVLSPLEAMSTALGTLQNGAAMTEASSSRVNPCRRSR